MGELYIGLMSGTSLDGVDGVLVGDQSRVISHSYSAFPASLRQEFLELNSSGNDELHRAALAANALARIYAQVVSSLLASANVGKDEVVAIGAHGQTVRHRPQEFDVVETPAGLRAGGYTVQLNNPAMLAELTGIHVVADFRSRDVAAGGQGAPLVPAFHQAVFGQAQDSVAVLNIGGISNVTLLAPLESQALGDVIGFDCGPGNALMDYWCQLHTGQAFDADGRWAAAGRVDEVLLKTLLEEPYFAKPPPKSTGRDLFNVAWLDKKLAAFASHVPIDIQATLTELTAAACANSIKNDAFDGKTLIVCGGGALNTFLLGRLQARLSTMAVTTSATLGLPPLQVEAAAFAWLARKAIRRETGSLPKVTGTQGARILGAIYPA